MCVKDEKGNVSPFGEVISTYTRQQAIEDGVLIDVSNTAKEAGIVYPTTLTRGVWGEYVKVPEVVSGLQDEQGRLWDILWMLRFNIKKGRAGPELLYKLSVLNEPQKPKTVRLKALCGPGDDADPVITIMLPHED